jgi:hypothetical protein
MAPMRFARVVKSEFGTENELSVLALAGARVKIRSRLKKHRKALLF